jgi:hypothetical protein
MIDNWKEILLSVIAAVIYELARPISRLLVSLAVTLIPNRERDRFRKKWLARLDEIDWNVGKLSYAATRIFVAGKLVRDFKNRQHRSRAGRLIEARSLRALRGWPREAISSFVTMVMACLWLYSGNPSWKMPLPSDQAHTQFPEDGAKPIKYLPQGPSISPSRYLAVESSPAQDVVEPPKDFARTSNPGLALLRAPYLGPSNLLQSTDFIVSRGVPSSISALPTIAELIARSAPNAGTAFLQPSHTAMTAAAIDLIGSGSPPSPYATPNTTLAMLQSSNTTGSGAAGWAELLKSYASPALNISAGVGTTDLLGSYAAPNTTLAMLQSSAIIGSGEVGPTALLKSYASPVLNVSVGAGSADLLGSYAIPNTTLAMLQSSTITGSGAGGWAELLKSYASPALNISVGVGTTDLLGSYATPNATLAMLQSSAIIGSGEVGPTALLKSYASPVLNVSVGAGNVDLLGSYTSQNMTPAMLQSSPIIASGAVGRTELFNSYISPALESPLISGPPGAGIADLLGPFR